MSVVTTMNRQETQMLVGTFQNLAKETGFTTTEIAKLSTVYFRQGRALKDVIELTTIAAKAARVAGIGAIESANLLTAAVNGFGLAAKEAEAVSDKFAALAASSASSYQELAVGLSKFASQAKVAGLSLDFAMGLLAKGVETTREAPESIGTALKTVLARMRELTDLGKTLEDGMDVSRVDTALRQIGVNLRDTNGQFRDMEDVLTEVGNKFSSLNKMQQASVAVSLAGTRQQSRLLAIFQDFDRTLELVETSEESAGATMAQHLKFMEGMEASLTNLRTSYQKFITTITESEVVIGIVRTLSSAIDGVTNILNSLGLSGKNAMIIMIGLAGAMQSYNLLMRISKTQLGEVIGLNKIFNADTKISTLLTSLRNKINLQEIMTNYKKIISGEQTNLVEKKNLLLQSIGIKNITKKLFLLPAELATMKMKIVLTNLDTASTNLNTAATKKKTIADFLGLKAIKAKILAIKAKTIADFLGVKAIKAKILAINAFNTSLLASPIGPIILALMLLVGAFMLLKKGAEDSKNGVDSFASGLFKGIQALGAIFKSLFDALKGLFNILKPFILIFAAVSFGPIIIAVGKILLVFKAITIVIRILNVILQRVVHFFKEFVSNSPLLKNISEGFKFIVGFGKQVVDFFRKGAKVFSE
jgi:TP901 family phage tail tape measure protein